VGSLEEKVEAFWSLVNGRATDGMATSAKAALWAVPDHALG